MANKARGFVEIEIGDEKFVVGMTLDATAEIAAEIGATTVDDVFLAPSNPLKAKGFFVGLLRGNAVLINERRNAAISRLSFFDAQKIAAEIFMAGGLETKGAEAEAKPDPLASETGSKNG